MIRTALLAALVSTAALADPVNINGAGATLPAPLYTKWFAEYNKLHPDIRINYQPIGSGGGIKQVTEGTVDFGASDAPMSDEELKKAPDILHLPTVLGAVVVVYHLPTAGELKLTPETLAGIFLGKITKWNDPALKKDNPKANLPDTAITIAHRSDGSGTTAVFTEYLSKVSADWKSGPGAGKSIKWPVGLGGKGNDGVTALVKQTPGTIGYVELAYGVENKLAMADLKNHEGHFIKPSVESLSLAAAGALVPDDFRTSLTDAPGAKAYPISLMTYLLVHKDMKDDAKGKAIVEFLHWAETDGQKLAEPLAYGPLPKAVSHKVLAAIKAITVNGKTVLAHAK